MYHPRDFQALAALIDAATAPERVMTASGLREFLDVPGFRPEADLFVAPGEDGSGLLGARDVRVTARGDEAVPILESWGVLHPAARQGAVGSGLLHAAMHRAGQIVKERERAQGIFQARCSTDDEAAQRLFESCGLHQARVLLTIFRPNLDNIDPPHFPEEIVVRPYRAGQDDDLWVDAFNDAFADHWGRFMGMSLAFWTRYVRRPSFRPEVSLVAWDGSEIAGFGHFRIDDDQNALIGRKQSVMRYIGVRPRWRRLGLGVALTRAGLLASRAAGMTACISGVDAENVTGAHHIYEREGFVTIKRQFMYRAKVPVQPEP